jgi:hypothetical protein
MTDASGRIVHTAISKSDGIYSVTATETGRYSFCFNNHDSSSVSKVVSFYVHEDHGASAHALNLDKQAEKNHASFDPVQDELKRVVDMVVDMREHQQYMVVREKGHRDTAESTNERVKWWGVSQLVLLVFVVGFQLSYLRRFFEVKRVV